MTADFCTIFTAFPFTTMISRTIESIGEAFTFQRENHPAPAADGDANAELCLGADGSYEGGGFTMPQLEELLTFLITHNYTCDRGKVRRQIQGIPMGMPAAPLEKVADDLYQSRTRDASLKRFRLFATERERYWVGRLNSLWPQGIQFRIPWEACFGLGTTLPALPCAQSNGAQ
jgi:hypothetical protein